MNDGKKKDLGYQPSMEQRGYQPVDKTSTSNNQSKAPNGGSSAKKKD